MTRNTTTWGQAQATGLDAIDQPVLVVNGDDDVMAPTINSLRALLESAAS